MPDLHGDRCEQTLIHGDVRLSNLGLPDDGIVLIDWGERTGIAPAAVELASFLIFDAGRLDLPRDDVIADFRDLYRDRFDERALDLALIGGMVQLGPNPVLDLVLHGGDDAALLGHEAIELVDGESGDGPRDVVADLTANAGMPHRRC